VSVALAGHDHHYERFSPLNQGVLQLTLRANAYDWQFQPVADGAYSDSGSRACVPMRSRNNARAAKIHIARRSAPSSDFVPRVLTYIAKLYSFLGVPMRWRSAFSPTLGKGAVAR
jgi:hypothetical protein